MVISQNGKDIPKELEAKKLNSKVVGIRFRNESNGYCVLDTEEADGNEIVVVGNLPFVEPGMAYEFDGEYINHPSYGMQFSASNATMLLPSGSEQIEKFLATGAIKGIGPKTANLIVRAFGDETLEIIAKDPLKLTKISGIGEKRALAIGADYANKQGVTEIGLFLQSHDIPASHALLLYKRYALATIEVLTAMPYEVLADLPGLSFKKIDTFSLSLGIERDDHQRIASGIMHIMRKVASDGSTYILRGALVEKATELLELSAEEIDCELAEMVFDNKLKIEKIAGFEMVFTWKYYEAEQSICSKLLELAHTKLFPLDTDIDQVISMKESEKNIKLSENQKHAVKTSVNCGVSIITGGPGTGKTTIIDMIIRVFESAGLSVAIAAPTGRAAKRITESSGYPASTIHRLLEYYYAEAENAMRFGKNSEETLKYEAIIIDEASMIDTLLMKGLMDAVIPGTRMIFVGDADQLPPVGAGNVLKDMLDSEALYSVRLTDIFRQAEESMIVVNAHRINRGELPYYNEKDKDFFLLETSEEAVILSKIKELASSRLPKYYTNCDPNRDIQVLTPTRKGRLGSITLNNELQSILNPPEKGKLEKRHASKVFRVGDRVMQMKNNYKIEWKKADDPKTKEGIFNGELGYICGIDHEEGSIAVEFDDGKVATYDSMQIDELDLAYALTVHKSQGSEFPIVIIPSAWFAPMLATRNLLYTAVTRGKQAVVVVGSRKYIEAMIGNVKTRERNTALKERLQKYGKADIWG